jgi:hypothetical protein
MYGRVDHVHIFYNHMIWVLAVFGDFLSVRQYPGVDTAQSPQTTLHGRQLGISTTLL